MSNLLTEIFSSYKSNSDEVKTTDKIINESNEQSNISRFA